MAKAFNLIIERDNTTVIVKETEFTIKLNDVEKHTIAIDDIVAWEKDTSVDNDRQPATCVVHYIKRHEKSIWIMEHLNISALKSEDLQEFCVELQQQFDKTSASRPKRLLVLLNPIGGRGKAQKMYDTVVTSVFDLAKITCDLVVSQRSKHLIEVMANYDCKDVDGIVMLGGDGTFAEVINVLIKKTQEEAGIDYNDPNAKLQPLPKPVSIIPTGS